MSVPVPVTATPDEPPAEWVETIRRTREFAAAAAFGVPLGAHEQCAQGILAALWPSIVAREAAARSLSARDGKNEVLDEAIQRASLNKDAWAVEMLTELRAETER